MIPASQSRRLPIWTVFKRSFVYAWERRDVLAVPYLIYTMVTLAVDLLVDYGLGPDSKAGAAFGFAVDEIFAMAFAVGIHRFVLLDEAGRGAAFFRWDRHFVQYLLTTLLLMVATGFTLISLVGLFGNLGMMLGVVDRATAMPIASPLTSALSLLLFFAMIGLAATFSRLLLLLPAAALGQQDRLRLVWNGTRGNGLRLLATLFLVMLPFVVVELSLMRDALTDQADPAAAKAHAGLAVQVAAGLISPIQLIVLTIMLALDYDALVRGGGPAPNARPRANSRMF